MYNENMKLWEEKNSTEVLNLSETNGKNAANGTISKTERKLIVKRWRDTIPNGISGVYQIKNKISGRYYIGSAKDFVKRFMAHLNELVCNTHCNKKLQNDWNKHGYENYEFSVLETCSPENRFILEQRYLDAGFRDSKLFLNINPVALVGSIREYPPELIKKMSDCQKKNTTEYEFYNFYTQESIRCNIHQLLEKYPTLRKTCLANLTRKHIFSAKGWTLKERFEEEKSSNSSIWRRLNKKIKNKFNVDPSIIYHFINIMTKEEFSGTKSDFITKYYYKGIKASVDILIDGKGICFKYWVLKDKLEEAMSGKTFASKRLLSIFNKIYSPQKYNLINIDTLEEFFGTEIQFREKYKNVNKHAIKLVFSKRKYNYHFWILKENYEKVLNDKRQVCKNLRAKLRRKNDDRVLSLLNLETGETFEGTHNELIKKLKFKISNFFHSDIIYKQGFIRKERLNDFLNHKIAIWGQEREKLLKFPFYQQLLEKHQNNKLLINNTSSNPSLATLA